MPTLPRIDYRIEKYQLTEASETPKIAAQWQQVINTCQQQKAGSTERLRIALQTVDYVTSFELPFRLMLIRAPQLIDKLREEGGYLAGRQNLTATNDALCTAVTRIFPRRRIFSTGVHTKSFVLAQRVAQHPVIPASPSNRISRVSACVWLSRQDYW